MIKARSNARESIWVAEEAKEKRGKKDDIFYEIEKEKAEKVKWGE